MEQCCSQETDSTAWGENIMVGDDIDAIYWPTMTWARATVIDMGHRYVPARRFLRISYHGMDEKFDQWVCRWSVGIAPYTSMCQSFGHVEMTKRGNAFIEKRLSSSTTLDFMPGARDDGDPRDAPVVEGAGKEGRERLEARPQAQAVDAQARRARRTAG